MSMSSDDLSIATNLLAELQKYQDSECRNLVNFLDKVGVGLIISKCNAFLNYHIYRYP